MNELLFVGGPLDGQRKAVPNGARSYITPLLSGVWLRAAIHEDFGLPPDAVVPCQEAVYKRTTLMHRMPGYRSEITVMAYFGRAPEDRPKNFHL